MQFWNIKRLSEREREREREREGGGQISQYILVEFR